MVSLEDLGFQNKSFWSGFIVSSFPISLDEEADMGLSELMEENELVDIDIDWWSDLVLCQDLVQNKMRGSAS